MPDACRSAASRPRSRRTPSDGSSAARRARAALANELVDTVIHLIGKRKSNNKGKSRPVWAQLWRLGLQIEEGTRLKPVAVRLHVLSMGQPIEQVLGWFSDWEDATRVEAEAVGITLLTTRHHDATNMDAQLADRLVPLAVYSGRQSKPYTGASSTGRVRWNWVCYSVESPTLPQNHPPGRSPHGPSARRTGPYRTPKVVGGLTEACAERAEAIYGMVCDHLVRVCDARGGRAHHARWRTSSARSTSRSSTNSRCSPTAWASTSGRPSTRRGVALPQPPRPSAPRPRPLKHPVGGGIARRRPRTDRHRPLRRRPRHGPHAR